MTISCPMPMEFGASAAAYTSEPADAGPPWLIAVLPNGFAEEPLMELPGDTAGVLLMSATPAAIKATTPSNTMYVKKRGIQFAFVRNTISMPSEDQVLQGWISRGRTRHE